LQLTDQAHLNQRLLEFEIGYFYDTGRFDRGFLAWVQNEAVPQADNTKHVLFQDLPIANEYL
jgi:hypothetical protein